MPRPPGDPSQFDKVNYVIDAWAQPCEAPWYIYVETLWPALLEAFITLATFGWDDVARGFWRPRGLGRRTGKKRGKGRLRGIRGFPEIGEEIGKRIPTADIVKGRKWNWQGKTLWRIDSAAQRVLFWWLVADVTVDFAYNFTSVLYETHWCQASAKGRFSYRLDDLNVIPDNSWWFASLNIKEYEFPLPNWEITQGGIGANGAMIAVAFDFEPVIIAPLPTVYEVRIIDWPSRKVLFESGPVDADPDNKARIPAMGVLVGPSQYRVQVRQNGNAAFYTNGVITGMEA